MGLRRERRHVSVEAILRWAFGVEYASLDLPSEGEQGWSAPGRGIEAVLLERAQLGVQVEGGGRSWPHEDADQVASAVQVVGSQLGWRTAIRIAELARAGQREDWMPGAVPRCVPVEWRPCKHGMRARTEVVGREVVVHRGQRRTVERRCCPVTFDPHPRKIEAAREGYNRWWHGIAAVRQVLLREGRLVDHVLTGELPPAAPWLGSIHQRL